MKYFIQNSLYVATLYLDFRYIQTLSIFRTQDIRYREALEYSFNRTLCNLDIFITYIYSSPSILRTRGIWWTAFYETLCNTGISELEAYSELTHISIMKKLIKNHVKP